MATRRFIQFTATAMIIGVLGCLTTSLPAQSPTQSSAASDSKELTIDLKFDGGTVQEYIAAIRRAVSDVNIMLDINDIPFPMPAVELNHVDLDTATGLLNDRTATIDGIETRLEVNRVQRTHAGRAVFVISSQTVRHSRPPRAGRETARQRSTVLSVKEIMNAGLSPEDVLTAVQTALELFEPNSSQAQIRFHEQTGLLIARGSSEQMDSIHEVIEQLQNSAIRSTRMNLMNDQHKEVKHEFIRMQQELENQRNEFRTVVQELAETRMRNELVQQELDRTRAQLEKSVQATVEYTAQVEKLRFELTHLRAQLQQP